MIRTVELTALLEEQLRAEAMRVFPRECCGLIEGSIEAQTARVFALHPAGNLAAPPDRFEIDPAAHFVLLRLLRDTERAIIGCYHSHPNGRAGPSARDRETAAEIGFLWLIAAVSPDAAEQTQLAAFVSTGKSFLPLQIVNAPETAGLRPAAGGIPGVDRSAGPLL
jgi:proteasome lid subunit RPN8/RPN11